MFTVNIYLICNINTDAYYIFTVIAYVLPKILRFTDDAEGSRLTLFEDQDYFKPTVLKRTNCAAYTLSAPNVPPSPTAIAPSHREKLLLLNSARRRMQDQGLALPKSGGLAVASIGKLATRLSNASNDDHRLYSTAVDYSNTSARNSQIQESALGQVSATAPSELVTATSVDGRNIDDRERNMTREQVQVAQEQQSAQHSGSVNTNELIEKSALLSRLAEDPLQGLEAVRPPRRPIVKHDTLRTFSTGVMVENTTGSTQKDDEPYQLYVETGRMIFAVHPLMIREEWLGSKLLSAFREHSRRETSKLEQFYTEKYCAVLSAIKRLLAANNLHNVRRGQGRDTSNGLVFSFHRDHDTNRFHELVVEAKEFAERVVAEEESFLMRVEYLEEIYGEIEHCRSSQQFRATSIVLMMEIESDSVSDKRADLCSRAKTVMKELESLVGVPRENVVQVRSTQDTQDGVETDDQDKDSEDRVQDEDSEIMVMIKDLSEALPFTLPQAARKKPVLARDASTEENALPPEEIQRRRQIARTTVWTKLMINGRYAGKSSPIVLRRDFTVPLHFSFPVQVLSWPTSVVIQLWERRAATPLISYPASQLAELPVPLPGFDDSSTYYPFVELHFTSTVPFTPSWISTANNSTTASADDSSAATNDSSINENRDNNALTRATRKDEVAVFISGDVHIQSSWGAPRQYTMEDEREIEEGYRMPPRPEGVHRNMFHPFSASLHSMSKYGMATSAGAPLFKSGSGTSAEIKRGAKTNEESLISKMLHRDHNVDGTVGYVSGFQMRQWMQGFGFDPNDPRNADLIELMRRSNTFNSTSYGSNYNFLNNDTSVFRVPPYRLATIEGIALEMSRQRKRRYDLLKIRWEQELTNSVEVPLLESLMDETPISSRDLKKSVKELKMTSNQYPMGMNKVNKANAAFAAEKVVEQRILAIEAFEQRVFDVVMANFRRERGAASLPGNAGMVLSGSMNRPTAAHNSLKKTDDYVKDIPIPTLLVDATAISDFFAPRRKLKPKQAKKQQTSHPTQCFIHVNVLRGFNLPMRSSAARFNSINSSITNNSNANRNMRNLTGRSLFDNNNINNNNNDNNINSNSSNDSEMSRPTLRRDFMRQLAMNDSSLYEPEPELPSSQSRLLSPFVEVKLLDSVARTRAVEGTHVSFNEQLSLPFSPRNGDFSPSNLLHNEQQLIINVFDETVDEENNTSTSEYGISSTTNRSKGTRRFFLGSVRISTSSIYRLGNIQGKFRLEVPQVLIGFEKQHNATHSNMNNSVADYDCLPYISLYISLDPNLAVPFPILSGASPSAVVGMGHGLPVDNSARSAKNASGATTATASTSGRGSDFDEVMDQAIKWQREVFANARCKNRYVIALVSDSLGQTHLPIAFISPLSPPKSVWTKLARVRDGNTSSNSSGDLGGGREGLMTVLHRFVSLIPMVDAEQHLGGSVGNVGSVGAELQRQNKIWATCAETIDMACGDYIEHAILLANYFLSCKNVNAYVVLGSGIQNSEMSFVLTIHSSPKSLFRLVRLWNPVNGTCYINNDTGCDLLSVGMVFNNTNMWANVQDKSEPWNINFDLHDSRSWMPLFTDATHHYGIGRRMSLGSEVGQLVTATSTTTNNHNNNNELDPQVRSVPSSPSPSSPQTASTNPPPPIPPLSLRSSQYYSVQRAPTYSELPREFYDDLEAQVERDTLDAILEARLPLYTHQNTRARRILRSLAKDLEKSHLMIQNAQQVTPFSQAFTNRPGSSAAIAASSSSNTLRNTNTNNVSSTTPGNMSNSNTMNTNQSATAMMMMMMMQEEDEEDNGNATASLVQPLGQSQSLSMSSLARSSLVHSQHTRALQPVSRSGEVSVAAFQLCARYNLVG